MFKRGSATALIASVAMFALVHVANATVVFQTATAEDGDEAGLFNIKPSLTSTTTSSSFFGSVGSNTTVHDVGMTTGGTVSSIGNGNANIKGNNSGTDFFTSITFTPTNKNAYDGMFVNGMIGSSCKHDCASFDGNVLLHIVGSGGSITDLTFSGVSG